MLAVLAAGAPNSTSPSPAAPTAAPATGAVVPSKAGPATSAPAGQAAPAAAANGANASSAAMTKPATRALPAPPRSPEANATHLAATHTALQLPENVVEAAVHYRASIEDLKKPGVEDPFCAAFDEATALAAALAPPLTARRTAVAADEGARQRFTVALEAMDRELPGIHLSNGSDMLHVSRDDEELAGRAPTLAGEDLLARSGLLLRPWPGYLLQITEQDGCVQLDAATSLLVQLRRAWELGPKCLRKRLKPELEKGVARLAAPSWFCDDETRATAALTKTKESLDALPAELGGRDVAKKLDQQLHAEAARFGRDARAP